ncbi:unnamed protein product [Lepeophtheirus salmonis]|uniref:(salmon louse) hypothetical protein n=1 Tax=Lepeophtheirus salmonis TaxID=72036 RepID=A0A7R8D1E4_LEPSM|nr:unnamed protein product [Lepeophtheirus salmonis]CAF2949806.1 unnamed protein product [Lepeophtheirus salmonis]
MSSARFIYGKFSYVDISDTHSGDGEGKQLGCGSFKIFDKVHTMLHELKKNNLIHLKVKGMLAQKQKNGFGQKYKADRVKEDEMLTVEELTKGRMESLLAVRQVEDLKERVIIAKGNNAVLESQIIRAHNLEELKVKLEIGKDEVGK